MGRCEQHTQSSIKNTFFNTDGSMLMGRCEQIGDEVGLSMPRVVEKVPIAKQ